MGLKIDLKDSWASVARNLSKLYTKIAPQIHQIFHQIKKSLIIEDNKY